MLSGSGFATAMKRAISINSFISNDCSVWAGIGFQSITCKRPFSCTIVIWGEREHATHTSPFNEGYDVRSKTRRPKRRAPQTETDSIRRAAPPIHAVLSSYTRREHDVDGDCKSTAARTDLVIALLVGQEQVRTHGVEIIHVTCLFQHIQLRRAPAPIRSQP